MRKYHVKMVRTAVQVYQNHSTDPKMNPMMIKVISKEVQNETKKYAYSFANFYLRLKG